MICEGYVILAVCDHCGLHVTYADTDGIGAVPTDWWIKHCLDEDYYLCSFDCFNADEHELCPGCSECQDGCSGHPEIEAALPQMRSAMSMLSEEQVMELYRLASECDKREEN